MAEKTAVRANVMMVFCTILKLIVRWEMPENKQPYRLQKQRDKKDAEVYHESVIDRVSRIPCRAVTMIGRVVLSMLV